MTPRAYNSNLLSYKTCHQEEQEYQTAHFTCADKVLYSNLLQWLGQAMTLICDLGAGGMTYMQHSVLGWCIRVWSLIYLERIRSLGREKRNLMDGWRQYDDILSWTYKQLLKQTMKPEWHFLPPVFLVGVHSVSLAPAFFQNLSFVLA